MTVNESLQALGSWSLRLVEGTPAAVLDALDYFSHVAVVPGRVKPAAIGDALLTQARYVGVLRGRSYGDQAEFSGVGMAYWLGDEDEKGAVYETAIDFTTPTGFGTVIATLLPDAIHAGTLYSVGVTYTGRHIYQTPRKAISYVCDTVSTDAHPVEWRVNGNGTLDAGRVEDLYDVTPSTIIVRKGAGADVTLRALPGDLSTEQDLTDYTTRVVLLAEGEGEAITTGDADAASIPAQYVDLFGNVVRLTRMVSESGTSTANAASRAQLALNRFANGRRSLKLSAGDYDIAQLSGSGRGSFNVGDYVYAYDPGAGLIDYGNAVVFRGRLMHPIRIRVTQASWPVVDGFSVLLRRPSGEWLDLSRWIEFESRGKTSLTVGDIARSLTSAAETPGIRPNLPTGVTPDLTFPDVPNITSVTSSSYQADDTGETKAEIQVAWVPPNNTDGTTITDGDHYEIRYRSAATP